MDSIKQKDNTLGVSDTLLIGFDHSHGDTAVLIVGRRSGGTTLIINQFEGNEAEELYQKLVIKK